MSIPLPSNPDIAKLKKLAKLLFKQFKQADPSALVEISQLHPAPDRFRSLRDAQLVIARRYGLAGWQDLKHAVEMAALEKLNQSSRVDRFIGLACVRYDGRDTARHYRQAFDLSIQHPELANANLITAILCGNIPLVEKLIMANPAVVHANFTPLHWAPLMYLAYSRLPNKNTIRIARLLLTHGADPNAFALMQQRYKFTVLTGVIGEGEAGIEHQPPHQNADELAILLLDAGADPADAQALYNTMFTDSADKWLTLLKNYGLDNTACINWDAAKDTHTIYNFMLETAVTTQRPKRVNYLLDEGADPNAKCFYADRTIHTQALIANNPDIIHALERAGAVETQINKEDLLRIAVARTDVTAINALLDASPDDLHKPELYQDANLTVLRVLANRGYSVNTQDPNGKTILHSMSAKGKLDEVTWLLEQGADPLIRDRNYNGTAVGWAHFNQQPQVRDYLLNHLQDTCLLAATGRLQQLEQVLSDKPELASLPGNQGNTPLHLVCNWLGDEADEELRECIMRLLIANGADINALNENGQTPLDFNLAEGLDENVELLDKLNAKTAAQLHAGSD